jgi:hypothetical protein
LTFGEFSNEDAAHIGGQPAHFSIDSDKAELDNFNANVNDDFGDWAAGAGSDALLASSSSEVANEPTAQDVALLDAIGWSATTSLSPTTVVSPVVISDPGIANVSGDLNDGETVPPTINTGQIVRVSSYTPTLTLSDGGIPTCVGGSGTASLAFSDVVVPGQNAPDLQSFNLHDSNANIMDGNGNSPNFAGAATNPAGICSLAQRSL